MSEEKKSGCCETKWNRDNWPIAAAMNGFSGVLPDGSLVQDQPADHWAATLQSWAGSAGMVLAIICFPPCSTMASMSAV